MADVYWDDSLSVNIADIDRQHQRFLAIANKLSEALRQSKGPDFVGNVVDELLDYAEVHFKTEEQYFLTFGYPEAEKHIIEHGAFIDRVSAIKSRLDKGEGVLSLEMVRFVSTWLLTHIKKIDKEYSQFLNDKGLR